MNLLALAVLVLVVLDPLTTTIAAAVLSGNPRSRATVVTVGIVLAAVLLGGAALVADPLLDWLDISDPAAALAAGIVVAVPALELLWRGPEGRVRPVPDAPPIRLGAFPLAVPVIVSPAALLAVVAWSGAEGAGTTLAAVVLALAVTAVTAIAWSAPPTGRAARIAGAFAGAATAVVAFDLVRDGIFTT